MWEKFSLEERTERSRFEATESGKLWFGLNVVFVWSKNKVKMAAATVNPTSSILPEPGAAQAVLQMVAEGVCQCITPCCLWSCVFSAQPDCHADPCPLSKEPTMGMHVSGLDLRLKEESLLVRCVQVSFRSLGQPGTCGAREVMAPG